MRDADVYLAGRRGSGDDAGSDSDLARETAELRLGQGVAPAAACRMAMVRPITDDADVIDTLDHAIAAILG